MDSDTERVSSSSSLDERLEYYRKKYGEDFQFSGSASGPTKKSGKKKKSQSGQKSGRRGGSGNRGSQAQKGKKPNPKQENRQNRPDSVKKGPDTSGDKKGKTASIPEKKGLLGRLFKK